MIDRKGIQKQTICDNYCNCNMCATSQHVVFEPEQPQEVQAGHNSMDRFLEYLPRNFPLLLTPTAFLKGKQFYFNKFVSSW